MSELSGSTDAPPPPPPPPPPDTEAKEPTPDASPELANALSRENQDAGQSGADGGSQADAARMTHAQEQAADVKTQLEPYQQEPADVPDGTSVTPDASPEFARALENQDGSQSGSDGSHGDMAKAQDQADAMSDQIPDYLKNNAVEGGPPDVSPELAEALPQESEPLTAADAAPDQVVEPNASQYEGQDSPQPVADGEQPLTPDLAGAEELADLQAGPDEVDSGPTGEPPQADSDTEPQPAPEAGQADAVTPESEPVQSDANLTSETEPEPIEPEPEPAGSEADLIPEPEPERAGADFGETDPPQPEASAEPRSEAAEGPDTTQADSVTAEPTRGAADAPSADRPDIVSRYPADYVPSTDPPPTVDGPHESPGGWAADVNPDRDAPGRNNNCGECARATESTWEGNPAAPAAMANPDPRSGEDVSRMAEWAGQAPTDVSLSDVQQRLEELGPGSSAIVGSYWNDGGGHWYNAVNDEGTVKAVDGQSGLVETWPPSKGGLGFSETDMSDSIAVFFSADGKVVRQ